MQSTLPMTSQTIGKIFEALSQAQIEFKPVLKDKQAYNYKYADLPNIIDATKEALNKYKLTITQLIQNIEGASYLITILGHSSGEYLASQYTLLNYAKPTEFGTQLTYARRYSYSAIVGVASEDDDDGAKADAAKDEEPKLKKNLGSSPQVKPVDVKPKEVDLDRKTVLKSIKLAVQEKNLTAEDFENYAIPRFNLSLDLDKKVTSQLTNEQLKEALSWIDCQPKQYKQEGTFDDYGQQHIS